MPALQIARIAAHLVTGLGVNKIVSDIVRNNTVVITTYQKVVVTAGSLVLSSMLVQQAENHLTAVMDGIQVRFEKDETDDKPEQ